MGTDRGQAPSGKNIAMQEIPSDYKDPRGYFSNEFFRPDWSHTRDRRAGEWHNIGRDNFFMDDGANVGAELPRMRPDGTLTGDLRYGWMEGSMNWKIPVGWNGFNSDNDDDLPVKSLTPYWQQFYIDKEGTVRVAKLGWIASRGTNNVSRVWRRR